MEFAFPENQYGRPTDDELARGLACNFIVSRNGGGTMTILIANICRQHVAEMERNNISPESFVGAGTSKWNHMLGVEEPQWGSVSAMEAFGRNRPKDPAEAERVRLAISETIGAVRLRIGERLGHPLVARGAA